MPVGLAGWAVVTTFDVARTQSEGPSLSSTCGLIKTLIQSHRKNMFNHCLNDNGKSGTIIQRLSSAKMNTGYCSKPFSIQLTAAESIAYARDKNCEG